MSPLMKRLHSGLLDHLYPKKASASTPNTKARGMTLYVEDLSVSFDGFKALNKLTFYLEPGELRCFIGPNGAGKTTMMDCLTGKTRPDSGSAFFCPNPEQESLEGMYNLLNMDEVEIARAGIGRKFQRPSVIESLSVYDNLKLAAIKNKSVCGAFSKTDHKLEEDIEAMLDLIRLSAKRDVLSGILSHGQKQWLEIGMLLITKPYLVMLDEPAAGMTGEEIELTIELLQQLKGRQSIMVIEHDMAFIRAIADKVTVLNQGTVLSEGSMDKVANDEAVIEAYLGRDK